MKGTLSTAALLAAPSVLWPSLKAYASPDLRVGVIAPSHCAAPYFITSLSGRFVESGLHVELQPYNDMKEAVGDLLAGKLQAAQLTVPLFLALRAGTGPVDSPRPVIATQITGTEGGAILVKKGSGISQIDQLQGLRIASHTPLTVHSLILAALMEKRDFVPQSIRNIQVLPIQEMVPALAGGEIDAFIMPEPVNSLASYKNVGDILMRTRMLWKGHPCCLTATTEGFIADNREVYQAFTDQMVRTGLEMDAAGTRPATLGILKKSAPYGKLPPQVLASAFSPDSSGFEPFPYLSSFVATMKLMEKHGSLKPDAPVQLATAIDREFVSQAYRNLNRTVPDPEREEKVAGETLV